MKKDTERKGSAVLSYEERSLLAHQNGKEKIRDKSEPIPGLPKGKIGGIELSRLILGSNPLGGGAHARSLMYVSRLMKEYMTDEKILDTLQLCEENGIDTIIANPGKLEMITKYRERRGGKMQMIGQTYPDLHGNADYHADGTVSITRDDVEQQARWVIDEGCVGAAMQGARADRLVRYGRLDLIEDFVSFMRSNGVLAGVGGHDVRVPMECEKSGINVDFYFKTIHPDTYWDAIPENERRPYLVDSHHSDDHDCMWEQFPAETIKLMKKVEKPWIGFKVLAAGAIAPKEGFRFAFENGADFVCAGMLDFQVKENVRTAIETLSKQVVKNRARPWAG